MKQQEILFFLGSAVVVVLSWIAFTLVHNSLTSTISENVNQIISPIQPTFDAKVLDILKKRVTIQPAFTISGSSVSPTPTITPQPSLVPSEQTASQGGSLQ